MSIIKLGIGLPAYGGKISAEHARMWLEVGHALAASSGRFVLTMLPSIVDVCQVDKARCMLVDAAIEAQCDWLLMLDADTWVAEGYQLLVMISEAERQGSHVVVGAVPRRNTDGTRELMAYQAWAGEVTSGIAAVTDAGLQIAATDLIPITEAATACMAINLPFVTKHLARPWFRFTETASEDRDFCRRINHAGGVIVVDRRVQTRHLNRPAVLTWDGAHAG